MYKAVNSQTHFPAVEEEVLQFWQANNVFQKSIDKNADKEEFVFYDGPPFATGLPHFGHFVPSTVKDIIPRYQAMKGKKVNRRFGWDCHGLPVEYEVEKELQISGKVEIEQYGIHKFNEYCRSIVLRYSSEWRRVIERLGRWVDFENDYKTMDLEYMESIWWVFKQLWSKGYIYEGHYILPYSPKLATPLSNFEVNLGGYQQVHDPSLAVKFALREKVKHYFIAWTTTPWTLPSNQGLAVGTDIDYVQIMSKESGEHYILAEDRLEYYFPEADIFSLEKKIKGKDLVDITYEPLFPYFKDMAALGAFRVFEAGFVSTEDGTGIVHMAGGFGEDDNEIICKQAGLPIVCPVDAECKFTSEVPDYEGLFVKDADKAIIKHLKEEQKVLKHEQYLHSYPFCYRTKEPLIYRAIRSWFVDISKIKERMIAVNQEIEWHPSHLKEGRFGRWLETARDWAISRNRYWGNPIPVWANEDGTYFEVIGSIEELEQKSGKKVSDLHKHYVDEYTWDVPGKGTMHRVSEVLDCWFESGAMPYAQQHYPFENKEFFESHFPADFISEGLDQTRGWFYTLVVLGAGLLEKPAFKSVIVSGLVLAEDGKKMSKSERNYTDPMEVVNKYGADALRLFLMNSSILKAEDLKYSDASVREEMKNFILPLWSAYSFFVTYANIDEVMPQPNINYTPHNPLDHWILSELSALVLRVDDSLALNNISPSLKALYNFLDLLNNWYIRRSRRRFWRSNNDTDKMQGYDTLYTVLLTFIKLSAPIIPFITEAIYQNLKTAEMPESVHLCKFPVANYTRDEWLEEKMRTVRRAVALGRGIRSLHQLKNRQPLSAVYLVTRDDTERKALQEMEAIVQDELNVKEVVFRQNEEDLVAYQIKANYKVLGKELGKRMKDTARIIEGLSSDQIKALLAGNELTLDINGYTLLCDISKVVLTRTEKHNLKVLNEGSLTAALDPELTQELVYEGFVRDLVRNIQTARKEANFEVTERITISFDELSAEGKSAIQSFTSYLKNETLITEITWEKKEGSSDGTGRSTEFSFIINEQEIRGTLQRDATKG